MHNVPLNDQEVQLIYDWLLRRRMYKPTDCPLGNPYKPWMEDTITRLKPFVHHSHD